MESRIIKSILKWLYFESLKDFLLNKSAARSRFLNLVTNWWPSCTALSFCFFLQSSDAATHTSRSSEALTLVFILRKWTI